MKYKLTEEIKDISDHISPVLKWFGEREKIAEFIISKFPKRGFECYYEPFFGGGTVFFELMKRNPLFFRDIAYLTDVITDVIDCHRVIRDDLNNLIPLLNSEDFTCDTPLNYYRIRSMDPKNIVSEKRAARILFLNKTCNGFYRENKKGIFNASYSRKKRKQITYNIEAIKAASIALQRTVLLTSDFEEIMKMMVSIRDFVFLDPPSQKESEMTRKSFSYEDYVRLSETCNILNEKGVRWMICLSEGNSDELLDLFKGKTTIHIENRNEVLVMNYGHTDE